MSNCIIFIHKGSSDYLLPVIGLTKHFNQKNRIILLGDDQNKYVANTLDIDFYHYADYSELIPYYHVSVNGRDYEKFCFERWFIIYNFIERHNISKFIHSDSDNIVCQDINTIDYENACIGNYHESYAIVPNIFISTSTTLYRIIKYYRYLYNQDYASFIRDIQPYTSNIVQEYPPVKLPSMHYSDMYFLLQTIKVLKLDFKVLPECGEIPFIFNGNYTNHPIELKGGIFIHGVTGQPMFNIHFQGASKSNVFRYYSQLTNTQ
jgi:hypothetical protein